MAAVLACGIDARGKRRADLPLAADRTPAVTRSDSVLAHWGAVLSRRSAAELWQLLPPIDGPVDISVPGLGGRRKRSGICLHRSRTLVSDSVTSRQGIPVTTPARTIADLGKAVPAHERRRAIRQAEVLGLATGFEEVTKRSRSDLELAFIDLCRRHRLPIPEVNVWIDSMQVDFLWRARRLIVETDGFRYHRGRAAFENDRDRDLKLRALGHDVIRLCERQVEEEPERIAQVLKTALGRRSPGGASSPS